MGINFNWGGLISWAFYKNGRVRRNITLVFYYTAYPPFKGYNFGVPQEGHYLLVDKTFIELMALIVLALFPGTLNTGVWSMLEKLKFRVRTPNLLKKQKIRPSVVDETDRTKSRRDLLKNLTFLPFLGSFAWAFITNKKDTGVDAFTGSTIKLNQRSLSEIEGEMPMGILFKGKPPVSRLIMGTNHLSGNAHARDLVYVNSLFKAYNTEKKIIETYMLAEKVGINLFFATPLLSRYKKIFGGDFQTWLNVAPSKKDIYSQVDRAIDQGVDYIFIQGAACDRRIYDGEVDVIAKCVDYIRRQGYPAGLGAHTKIGRAHV
jgi:hypothetical protein